MLTRPWQRHYHFDVTTPIRYPRVPNREFLQASAKAFPDKTALHFFGTAMTFWDLRIHILPMTNALGSLGVQKGDRVDIHLPTRPQLVVAPKAVVSLGGIVVDLNPMYTAEEPNALVTTNTGISTFITLDTVLSNIRVLDRVEPIIPFEKGVIT
ncbi:MAG: AMP-binding protein [Deltaproteobacteria bacterium]|nr:AMP-binding protein [Deltaproteobacteria bacterium]